MSGYYDWDSKESTVVTRLDVVNWKIDNAEIFEYWFTFSTIAKQLYIFQS